MHCPVDGVEAKHEKYNKHWFIPLFIHQLMFSFYYGIVQKSPYLIASLL